MKFLRVDNYIIDTPIINILELLKITLTNGKLREIKPGLDNIVVTCPVHSGGTEKNAACNIYIGDSNAAEYGFFRCFVCESKGTFVRFVSHCFGSSESFAKQWLIKNFGRLDTDVISLGEPINLKKINAIKKPKYIDKAELNKFQSWHPYLAQRKLSKEVCDQFNIKYDSYARQIIFPCFDAKGNLLMLPRRSIDTKVFYLDKEIQKPVYGLDQIIKNNYSKAMIVEGPIDTLTCWTNKVPAIGTLGNPSDTQIDQINKSNITCLYIAFDNDNAGQQFTKKVLTKISKRILTVLVELPKFRKDVNDLSAEEWQDLIIKYNLPQI